MEKLTNVTSTFSVFGNVSDLLSKVEAIKEFLQDYKHEESKGTLPNGLPTVSHVFHKANKAVIIRSYRLDIQFGYNEETNDTVEDFLAFVNESVAKLSSLANSKFNRVAYTDATFVRKNDENMKKFNEAFNVANIFGSNGDELQLRVNNITEVSGETTNAVTVIQNGAVQKKTQGETTPQAREEVIFVNNDINSSAFSREPRFTWDASLKLLSDYIMLAKERTEKVINKF